MTPESLKIEKMHTNKMLEYYCENNECSLIYLRKYFESEFDDFAILSKNNYSLTFFDYIIQKYSDTLENISKVFKVLFAIDSYILSR